LLYCASCLTPFFSPSSRPPRALHSFPTRRSSDLAAHGRHRGQRAFSRAAAQILRRRFVLRETRSVSEAKIPAAPSQTLRVSRKTDRKSTRLNSSHSQISYAVFCLKKKKKNKITQN